MFKHILLPTDGSVLSETAIKKGVAFAKEISAKVRGLTVTKPFHVFTTDVMPWEEISKTASERGCDVIFMASHGRRGMAALVIGSETNKVLTHTKIPCSCIANAAGGEGTRPVFGLSARAHLPLPAGWPMTKPHDRGHGPAVERWGERK
jgi:nucleotide-binding universal stress UspA family protein